MDSDLVRVTLKRKRDQEEINERQKIVVGIMTTIMAVIAAWYHQKFLNKEPSLDWDNERRHYFARLYDGNDRACIEQLRISKRGFVNLCNDLEENGGLVRTRHVPLKEAVAMFLYILAHNKKYRLLGFDCYRSKETISRQLHSVLHAFMRLSKKYIKLHETVPDASGVDKWKWFENCIGALDGTHIYVTVPLEERPIYRNRKGDITTNMLAACSPDMKLTYVLPGWEGSASDSRVLRDALRRPDRFHIRNDKYYLVDAGYTNGPGFLAPYRGIRYHLNEWVSNTPQNYKELFNLRHSVARNTIERSFGLLKKRWSILRTRSFFSVKTQIRIINACCVLHNFIRIKQEQDQVLQDREQQFLDLVDKELTLEQPSNDDNDEAITCVQVTEEWTSFRETLAKKMWDEYHVRQGQGNHS